LEECMNTALINTVKENTPDLNLENM